jgi:hypothetical protein
MREECRRLQAEEDEVERQAQDGEPENGQLSLGDDEKDRLHEVYLETIAEDPPA